MSWDVYAAGVLLYEMVSGRRGFTAPVDASPWEAAAAVMEVKAKTPCLDPGERCPEPVSELVRAWTSREPGDRPASASEALQALKAVRALFQRPSMSTRLSGGLGGLPAA